MINIERLKNNQTSYGNNNSKSLNKIRVIGKNYKLNEKTYMDREVFITPSVN